MPRRLLRLPPPLVPVMLLLAVALCSCSRCRVYYQYAGDTAMWEHTFSVSPAFVVPDAMPCGIIIPHHDICLFEQNSFYKALSQKGSPSVVVVLSPDHFEQGTAAITLPATADFWSPEGKIQLDKKLIAAIAKQFSDGEAARTNAPWQNEHGVFAHTPFIHHYFPGATLVPILLRPCATDKDFEAFFRLSKVLAALLPEDALVVASVDFSHYQIPRMTALHDEVSLDTVANMESPRGIEVDSPEALFTLTEYARLRGFTLPALVHRTCTFDKIPDEFVESTSHQYWAYYRKENAAQVDAFFAPAEQNGQRTSRKRYGTAKNLTLLIGGSGDVGAGMRTYWSWDRYQTSTDRGDITLRNLAGKEARFLSGFDAYLFDPAPGDALAIARHKTRLSVQVVSLDDVLADNGQDGTAAAGSTDAATVRILVIVDDRPLATGQDNGLPGRIVSSGYDVVVVRDNTGSADAFAYWQGDDGMQAHNLGILKSADGSPVTGSILCLNWTDGALTAEAFDYYGADGLVPAIHQFPAED